MSSKQTVKVSEFKPLHDKIFVTNLESGVRLTRGGLIIPDDNMSERGVHSRWGQVYSVGDEVDYVTPGEWVLIEHGRWTVGIDLEINNEIIKIWHIENKSILLVSDTNPLDTNKHTF